MLTLFAVKATVPVATPAPGATGATVAVKVTLSPKSGLGRLEVVVVVVEAFPTTCENGDDVAASYVPSPL
jgi:hypothetical protein